MSPIQLEPNPGDRFAATTIEAAKNNTLFGVRAEVAKRNASKVADYQAQWKQYREARDARPDATNIVAPIPARAHVVDIENGWPVIVELPIPVVEPYVYEPPKLTQSGWFTAGATTGTPDPFDVPVAGRVKYAGKEFMRIA